MSFQPALPLAGIVGYRFLQRTQEAQQVNFERDPLMKRETQNFRNKIGAITSAKELVADRQLLKVALGAFGLDDEIDKKFFLRKILEEGSENPTALGRKLVDPRYRKFAEAFGFGDFTGARNGDLGFASKIIEAYNTRQFEKAVGEQDSNMRLAMTFEREIGEFAASPSADRAAWFQVMGNTPLRKVFETAFSLPKSFGALDIDRQRDVLRERTQQMFGTRSLAAFSKPENVTRMVDMFLARAQAEDGAGAGTPGFSALTLLTNANRNSSALRLNLRNSRF